MNDENPFNDKPWKTGIADLLSEVLPNELTRPSLRRDNRPPIRATFTQKAAAVIAIIAVSTSAFAVADHETDGALSTPIKDAYQDFVVK